MSKLDGKTCIVTGASRGIGVAIAEAMAAEGANIAIGARNLKGLADTADRLKKQGTSCWFMPLDIARRESVDAFIAGAKEHFGGIDVLVNNAGQLQPVAAFEKARPDEWLNNIHANIDGMFHMSQACLPHLVASKGAMITLSSGMAVRNVNGYSAYCTSKAAMAMLSQALHGEYKDKGVRIYSFQPGRVDTAMQADIRKSKFDLPPVSSGPAYAPPEEPAKVITWLASQAGNDWCGQELGLRDTDLRKAAGLEG